MSKVISDGYAVSYSQPTYVEPPRNRGPEGREFIQETGKLLKEFPWQFTLIQADIHQAKNTEFHIFLSHGQGPGSSPTLCFQPSASCNYLPQNRRTEEESFTQHVVLPSTFGQPGEARTSLRITNGGDTDQYNLDGAYRTITAFEQFASKQVPADVTWCAAFNFDFEWPEAEHAELYCYSDLSQNIVTQPQDWMDSIQIQIIHGIEPKYLSVAFRFVDTDAHEINGSRYIKPILFDIVSVELDSERMDGQVLKSVYWVTLRRKAETNGYLTLPWVYLD